MMRLSYASILMNPAGWSRRSLLAASLAAGAGALLAGPLGAATPTAVGETRFVLAGPAGRSISVSEWRPHGRQMGTILFSHGAASSPRFYVRMIDPWVAAGYRVLAPLHVDSREHPDTAKYPGLASWKARVEDMKVLIAHVGDQPFIAAGHSFGGMVALTLGGSAPIPPAGMALPLYPRLARAVIAFSPPAPIPVLITAEGYGQLAVPALIETGSIDFVPGMTAPAADGWKGHLAAFDAAAPGGDRYALVLEGVDHYFGGAICSYDRPGPLQLERLADANRVAGLFLNAYGAGNGRAQHALSGLISDNYPVRLLHK